MNFTTNKDINCEIHVKNVSLRTELFFIKAFNDQMHEDFNNEGEKSSYRLPKGVSNESIFSVIDKSSIVDNLMMLILMHDINFENDTYNQIYEQVQGEMQAKVFVGLLSFTPKEDFNVIFDKLIAEEIDENCWWTYLVSRTSNDKFCNFNLEEDLVTLFVKVLSTVQPSKLLENCIIKSLNNVKAVESTLRLILRKSLLNKYEIKAERVKFLEIMDNVKNGTLACACMK